MNKAEKIICQFNRKLVISSGPMATVTGTSKDDFVVTLVLGNKSENFFYLSFFNFSFCVSWFVLFKGFNLFGVSSVLSIQLFRFGEGEKEKDFIILTLQKIIGKMLRFSVQDLSFVCRSIYED